MATGKPLAIAIWVMLIGVVLSAILLPAKVFAAAATQSIAVPMYEHPVFTNFWPAIDSAGGAEIPFLIVNPASGPGTTVGFDYPIYTQRISDNTALGIRSIGYVYTSNQTRAMSDVLNDIDQWYAIYPGISGIFSDLMTVGGASELCYASYVYNYAKSKHPSDLFVQNFGTYTSPSYEPYGDIFMNAEMGHAAYQFWTLPNDGFQDNPAFANRFWHIVHTTSGSDLATTIAQTRANNAGWVLVTDDTMPNPYDTAPTYMNAEISQVNSLPSSTIPNRGLTGLPTGCADVAANVTQNGSNTAGATQAVLRKQVTVENGSSQFAMMPTITTELTLPAGVTFTHATGTNWVCTGNDCEYSAQIAASGSSMPLALEFAVACGYQSGNITLTTTNFAGDQTSEGVTVDVRPSGCTPAAAQTSSDDTLASTGANAWVIIVTAAAVLSLGVGLGARMLRRNRIIRLIRG